MMNPRYCLRLLLFLLTFCVSSVTFAFNDLHIDDEKYLAIDALSREGVINGYADGTFQADQLINRAELLKILVESKDIHPNVAYHKNCFGDVAEQWFAPYVCYASGKGWVNGYSDGQFRPEQPVNKVEAMKMLSAVYGLASTSGVDFVDTDPHAWYSSYLGAAQDANIIREQSDHFYPDAQLSRGEVAMFIYRTLLNRSSRFNSSNNLILVGAGGDAGTLFTTAAQAYQRDNGGQIYEVGTGDQALAAIRRFLNDYVELHHLEYFGHGTDEALFVSQHPDYFDGVFAKDPAAIEGTIASSIYELPHDAFYPGGTASFNGCNIASGYPYHDSFAQDFANYFGVEVNAAVGPTEFIGEGTANVLLVPTYDVRGFVTVDPQPSSDVGLKDVHFGQSYHDAVVNLFYRGLDLDEGGIFKPYQYITYVDAMEFCRVAVDDASRCGMTGFSLDEKFRNLYALKLLVDASGIEVATTSPWYKGYLSWGLAAGILPNDFDNKTWITRGEMAEITWGVMNP